MKIFEDFAVKSFLMKRYGCFHISTDLVTISLGERIVESAEGGEIESDQAFM